MANMGSDPEPRDLVFLFLLSVSVVLLVFSTAWLYREDIANSRFIEKTKN